MLQPMNFESIYFAPKYSPTVCYGKANSKLMIIIIAFYLNWIVAKYVITVILETLTLPLWFLAAIMPFFDESPTIYPFSYFVSTINQSNFLSPPGFNLVYIFFSKSTFFTSELWVYLIESSNWPAVGAKKFIVEFYVQMSWMKKK